MAQCHHGYEQDQCLICQVLGTTAAPATSTPRRRSWLGGRQSNAPVPATAAVPSTRRHRPLATVALGVVVILAAVLAVWILIGAFYLALRIVELIAVAFAAGWMGYRIGHWRGRHER